jgi:hypothetical protein
MTDITGMIPLWIIGIVVGIPMISLSIFFYGSILHPYSNRMNWDVDMKALKLNGFPVESDKKKGTAEFLIIIILY